MRSTPGSLPRPVRLTRAGKPPRASTQRRISSWSVVVCAARPRFAAAFLDEAFLEDAFFADAFFEATAVRFDDEAFFDGEAFFFDEAAFFDEDDFFDGEAAFFDDAFFDDDAFLLAERPRATNFEKRLFPPCARKASLSRSNHSKNSSHSIGSSVPSPL